MVRRSVVAAVVLVLAASTAVTVQLTAGTSPARADGLRPWDSCDQLVAHTRATLARAVTPWGFEGGQGRRLGLLTTSSALVAADTAAAQSVSGAPAAEAVGPGESGTNVQEAGVDEPDRAKLRDGRLVVLARGRLELLRTGDGLARLGSLDLPAEDHLYGDHGPELLLAGERAVVVQHGSREVDGGRERSSGAASLVVHDLGRPQVPTTRLTLVDLAGDEPRLLETSTVDGAYLSARLAGGAVRLVTASDPVVRPVLPRGGRDSRRAALAENRRRAHAVDVDDVLPHVTRVGADGDVLEDGPAVRCADVTHPDEPRGLRTVLVTTIRPADGLGATDSTAVTAEGDLVYASAERLYVATSRWGTVAPLALVDVARGGGDVTTELHAFDTSRPSSTRYVGSGAVPGYLLNRWALSHHEGVLRAATTTDPPWRADGTRTADTSSMVVRLVERGGALVEDGRVEGLGRTEQIQSVRYLGDLAAVVTFRQTDPLYLIDLATDEPRVLGELKVPGYSAYLHPVGDGRLLGVGYDATDAGRIRGMQVSLFDVSDPARPSLLDRVLLGEGDAEAIGDARAFSYDPERRRATFAFASWAQHRHTARLTNRLVGVTVNADGTLAHDRAELGPRETGVRTFADEDDLLVVSDRFVRALDRDTLEQRSVTRVGRPG